MASRRRVDLRAILANADLRHDLMVSTIQATQAREGIETTAEQAGRAYYIATEADKTAFFDLEQFQGDERSKQDRREEMFVHTLRALAERVRFDVSRRDFGSLDTSPLAYRRVGIVGHIFREAPSLDLVLAEVKQGLTIPDSERSVRFHWEVSPSRIGTSQRWVPFAKGSECSRFYSDVSLLLLWNGNDRELKRYAVEKKGAGSRPFHRTDWLFKPCLAWPLRARSGFSVRVMPENSILGGHGAAILPKRADDTWYLLGIANSTPAEYLLVGMTSSGSWNPGIVNRLPVPQPSAIQRSRIGNLARQLHDAKATWDTGNETSTRFDRPWILRTELEALNLPARLDRLAEHEATEEARLRSLRAELDDEAYKLYGISDSTRALIEESMGERTPEILWPDMQRKTTEQKRMEHVWRLLSYVVKHVIDSNEDGIVPFRVLGEQTLRLWVLTRLSKLFAGHDADQLEDDITNELRRRVKGYRRVETLEEWLRDEFFEYHSSLYQGRPILWHIASAQGRGDFSFGAIVHYHKLDYDHLARLRGTYLRDEIAHLRHEADVAGQVGRAEDRQRSLAKLEEAEQFDRRLQWVQEGANGHPAPGDCRIRTPWKSEEEQPEGWQPDLDDGVIVNIAPMQTAGVLRTTGSSS